MQELWFLCSACRLMLTDIYIKFSEDSLNRFQVIELRKTQCAIMQFTALGKVLFLGPKKNRDISYLLTQILSKL